MDRGVRPMGLWSMLMTLSRYSSPSRAVCFPGRHFIRFRSAPSRLNKISFTSEDFPDPDTPVTQVSVPRGMSTSMPRRLFSAAPRTVSSFPPPRRRVSGTAIYRFPLRYCPVRDAGSAATSSGVPAAMIRPPWTPAPGPTSMI